MDKAASGPQFSHLSNGHSGALHSGEGSEGHRGSFIQSDVSANSFSPHCSPSACFLNLVGCLSGPRFLHPGSPPCSKQARLGGAHTRGAVPIVTISWPSVTVRLDVDGREQRAQVGELTHKTPGTFSGPRLPTCSGLAGTITSGASLMQALMEASLDK